MNSILGNGYKISEVRGKVIYLEAKFTQNKIACFCIFHPSYLLRQPTKKKLAWLDLLNLEKFLIEEKIPLIPPLN